MWRAPETGARLQHSAKNRKLLRARSVTFGFRARLFAHAEPARIGSSLGAAVGALAAFLVPENWETGQLPMVSNLDRTIPDVARYLVFMSVGMLVFFLVGYVICTLGVRGLSADIRGVEQSHRRWFASLPKNVVDALAKLEGERQPYIVCRKACHSYAATTWALFLGKRILDKLRRWPPPNWGLFNQMNYAIAIATVRALGARLWPYDEQKFVADVTTDRVQQKTVANDHDQFDLELRFVQDEPQRPFSGGDLAKPVYAVFQCLLNPINDPIWVLALSDVMERLKEVCAQSEMKLSFDAAVELLSSSNFPSFRRIDRDPQAGVRVKGAEDPLMPILKITKDADGTPHYRSGYDENNILYANVPSPVRKALYAFQLALDEAARKDAVRVDLSRGDMLIVRNQEAFYCRREIEDHLFSPLTLLPRVRWLRRYMAFEPQAGQLPSGRPSSSNLLWAMRSIDNFTRHIRSQR